MSDDILQFSVCDSTLVRDGAQPAIEYGMWDGIDLTIVLWLPEIDVHPVAQRRAGLQPSQHIRTGYVWRRGKRKGRRRRGRRSGRRRRRRRRRREEEGGGEEEGEEEEGEEEGEEGGGGRREEGGVYCEYKVCNSRLYSNPPLV